MELYNYRAVVTSVYDADTITIDIDLGFGVELKKQKIRLWNINAPEIRGEERPAGLVSRDALREKILGKSILLTTIKDKKGKYGRYIGKIFLPLEILNESEQSEEFINQWLIDNNYAVYFEY